MARTADDFIALHRKMGIGDVAYDPNNMDHAREAWRIIAEAAAQARATAENKEHLRKIGRDRLALNLTDQGIPITRAEVLAGASTEYEELVEELRAARERAGMLDVAAENARLLYWRVASAQADQRSERRMSM